MLRVVCAADLIGLAREVALEVVFSQQSEARTIGLYGDLRSPVKSVDAESDVKICSVEMLLTQIKLSASRWTVI